MLKISETMTKGTDQGGGVGSLSMSTDFCADSLRSTPEKFFHRHSPESQVDAHPPRKARFYKCVCVCDKKHECTSKPISNTMVQGIEKLKRARAAFQAGRMVKESFRQSQLEALVRMLAEHECDFVDALCRDLHKPRFETVVTELILVKNEALYAINNLSKWMEPQRVERNLATSLDECMVVSEPLGVVLVVGAWCSPIQLCLVPLVGAIAAGNCVIINPSETSSHTAELLHRLIPSYLDNECYHVLLASTSDLPEIAAARTLTPISLVLGGKNPCYVDQHCDIATAARRIAWARFQNAGQSAVAPDYILCHTEAKAQLLQALRCALMHFYGSDPRESRSFGRMVNAENFARVRDMLGKSGKVVVGGQVNEAEKYIAPTILTDVVEMDPIMQQEVLGPVLPILTSLMVVMPFGGVGASGMGSYHGRSSFDTFSHRKSCLLRGTRIECVTYLRYPPYEDRNLSLMTWASTLSNKMPRMEGPYPSVKSWIVEEVKGSELAPPGQSALLMPPRSSSDLLGCLLCAYFCDPSQ
ncbi:hypothetical protein JZ751_023455, partial [Albula glossodonta]